MQLSSFPPQANQIPNAQIEREDLPGSGGDLADFSSLAGDVTFVLFTVSSLVLSLMFCRRGSVSGCGSEIT